MHNPQVLLLGSTGQLGKTILADLSKDFSVSTLNRPELNFSAKEDLTRYILDINPNILVNACAYTDVDGAESNSKKAYEINSGLPSLLADICKDLDCLLVHYSTDYVFNGKKKGSYTEKDDCDPLNIYGKSKRQGEEFIIESGCKNIIFRTSWLYSPYRKNFLLTILRLAENKNQLRVIDDQIGCPTSCSLISEVTKEFLSKYVKGDDLELGLYHLASLGETSWYEFSKEIIKLAKKNNNKLSLSQNKILPILTDEYPLTALRPKNSVLDSSKIIKQLDLKLLTWQFCLKSTIKEIYGQ